MTSRASALRDALHSPVAVQLPPLCSVPGCYLLALRTHMAAKYWRSCSSDSAKPRSRALQELLEYVTVIAPLRTLGQAEARKS